MSRWTGRELGDSACGALTHTRFAKQADNINSIVKAAGITVEPYWPSLFAKFFAKKSVDDLIANVGAGAFVVGVGVCECNRRLRAERARKRGDVGSRCSS